MAGTAAAYAAYDKDPKNPGCYLYRGTQLRVQATPAVHNWATEQVQRATPSGGRVLEVAAGMGALSQRLADLGYDITATSWNGKCKAKVNIRDGLDLNLDWGTDDVGGTFDTVCAVEIIEHVESPARFLRSLRRVVKPGGTVVVTTPNISSALSRLQFLVRGYVEWFSAEEVATNGHIAMISDEIMRALSQRAGFSATVEMIGSDLPEGIGPRALAKRAMCAPIALLARGDVRGSHRGYVLRPSGASRAAAPDMSF